MKYVLRAVNVLAAVIIALALLVLLRTVFTPAGEVPTLGGYSFMRTLTGSMEPAIPVHSFLITDDVDPESLQVGDIITFRSTEPNLEGALNTHRITSVYEENGQLMFHTKGDANAVEDSEPVAAVNVVGKVVFVSAAIGTVVSLFANPLVFLLLIVVPLVLLLGFEFAKLVKSTKEVARAEDEAALRAAVEEIRRKRAAERADVEPAATEPTAGRAAEHAGAEPVDAAPITVAPAAEQADDEPAEDSPKGE